MKNRESDGTYYYPAEPHILSDGYETYLFALSILEIGYNPKSSAVSGNDYREWTDMVPDGAKLDYFDESLTSEDNTLRLNIGPTTNVETLNGQQYTCSPENSELLVYYTTTTFSIPAQTTPQKVIVLCEY